MSVEEWLESKRRSGRKDLSLKAAGSSVRSCLRWLEVHGMSTAPEDIDGGALNALRAGLPWKESTKRNAIGSVSQWVEWETGTDPRRSADLMWNDIQYERVRITPEEYHQALSYAYGEGDRDTVLALVLGATMGLRRSEMAGIRMSDIRPDGILVHGKGHGPEGKIAIQPMPPETAALIRRMSKGRCPEDHLLTLGDGCRSEAVAYLFKRLSRQTGIRILPHSLRRLYATTLYRQGVDIMTISQLMRHSSPSTTWRYITEMEDYGTALGALSKALYTSSPIYP